MLTLTGKTPVKFLHDDGTAETAVVLQPDDDEATLVRKLQRVVEMSTGLPARLTVADLAAAKADFPPLFDAQAAEAAVAAQSAMGWGEGADLDSLPEA